jgi:hypothetical protein
MTDLVSVNSVFSVVNESRWDMMTISRAVVLVLAASCCALGAEPRFLPQKLLDDGWISLFDGQTLYGWQPVGDAKWEVAGGEIRTSGDTPGFLMTTTRWADFELHVEFKADPKTNSGVFLRSALKPTDPSKDCVELNIAPRDNPYPTASFVNRCKISTQPGLVLRGNSLQGFKSNGKPKHEINAWDGKWHAFDVILGEAHASISLDGERLDGVFLDQEATTPRIGHIGLQSREGPVAFRNVRLRPTGLRPLLNSGDLTGWNTQRAEKCKFEVTKEGELHFTNGPGQIETVRDFTNFVLQLDCKVNGDGLNSGVFFRALRTGRWAGYESQIQNGFKDGNRTNPKDFGTGGIYRRQPARRVVPNDREWFTKTIVADGPHMAVWVNGYQVSDWTDTRPEKENAREGLRLGPGAIAIQGHDPTTDFLFRNIRAMELPR